LKARFDRAVHQLGRHPLWLGLLRWSKTHSLPGMYRIPLYKIGRFLYQEINSADLNTRANSMAFSFFLSLFPAIIVLFTLLAYTPLYATFGEVLQLAITEIMPGDAGDMLFKTVQDVATIPRSGLLSFGFFLAIWFASNGMITMMVGLEKEYAEAFRRRNELEKRLIAIQLTFLMALILVLSVVLVILGNTILHYVFQFIRADFITRWLLLLFRWIVVLALFYAGISTIYRYGSSTHRKIPFFTPGATLATLLSILSSWGFSFYVDNFNAYNKVYGSIGTLIVLLVWLQLNCLIILIGFELNASILVLRARRKLKQEAELDPLHTPDNAP